MSYTAGGEDRDGGKSSRRSSAGVFYGRFRRGNSEETSRLTPRGNLWRRARSYNVRSETVFFAVRGVGPYNVVRRDRVRRIIRRLRTVYVFLPETSKKHRPFFRRLPWRAYIYHCCLSPSLSPVRSFRVRGGRYTYVSPTLWNTWITTVSRMIQQRPDESRNER